MQQQRSLKSTFGEIFRVVRFSTFSTVSVRSRNPDLPCPAAALPLEADIEFATSNFCLGQYSILSRNLSVRFVASAALMSDRILGRHELERRHEELLGRNRLCRWSHVLGARCFCGRRI